MIRPFSHSLWAVLSMISVAAIVLAGCAPTAARSLPAASPPSKESGQGTGAVPAAKIIALGFTVSQTGGLTKESKEQTQGLELWLDNVINAGGIKLKDGAVLTPEFTHYDDESKADRVKSLYAKLINDDKVELLISPYSSGLVQAAAEVEEQYGKVLISVGGASDTTMERGYKNIYQLYTPATRYFVGAVDVMAKLDASLKKIAILHEKDQFSTDVATAAQKYAKGKGYDIVFFESYDSGTTDFAPFIDKIKANPPDAIMGGGHVVDGTALAKQLFENKAPVKLISLLIAPAESTFGDTVGEGAENVIAPSQWEPLQLYTADAAKASNLPWYGVSLADFVSAYKAKYNYEPVYHSAGGYAAGLTLQKAIEVAGSLDGAQIKAALDKMDTATFYGRIKFDTSAQMHGKQMGHEMVYIQWLKNAAGKLNKQIVWPLDGRTADAQLRK